MEIKFENIILRDMIESDIEDYVRWFTTETEWSKTDAPWEPIESDEETERASWQEYYESVKDLPGDVRRWKFEIEWNGRHIGWVSSYPIDDHYEWIGEIQDGQTVHRAIGIDICEPNLWGNCIGTNALRAFMNYYFESGVDELYTQTWSGNVRMLRCAAKLGFVECNRNVGTRQVEGEVYDGLTFRMAKPSSNLRVSFYDTAEDSLLRFAVIISRHDGKWVFCKHRERDTYEIPGGHREPCESIIDAAKRELREETGANEFEISPVCVYSVTGKNRVNKTGEETFGMLYYANIQSFERELHSEMESVHLFDELPKAWTYPLIQPLLIREYQRRIDKD